MKLNELPQPKFIASPGCSLQYNGIMRWAEYPDGTRELQVMAMACNDIIWTLPKTVKVDYTSNQL